MGIETESTGPESTESMGIPPARVGAGFYRAHGLGNDYLVFEGADGAEGVAVAESVGWPLTPEAVRRVCDRQRGVGGDGIVVLLGREPADGVFPLRMFNPDGSEFERSGNGLRILASHLFREGLVAGEPFRVRSGGSVIPMTVHGAADPGRFDVSVEMGQASVGEDAVALRSEHLDGRGRAPHPHRGPVEFVPVSVGNPHAVVFLPDPDDEVLAELGPFLAGHPAFAQGTNVQLVEVVGPDRLRIRIWERGVGRTSASGTSSCAAAVAAVSTGRIVPGPIQVEMEGGVLEVSVDRKLGVVLRGPVEEVAEGRLTDGFLRMLEAGPVPDRFD